MLKAVYIVLVILIAYCIQLFPLSLGQARILDFRCDAEQIGYKRYKVDVNENVNFIFDMENYFENYAIFGDGSALFEIDGSQFSHIYSMEGIYNVSLWAVSYTAENASEWLIIEVDNDAPEFNIGYTSVEYHQATYDFEYDDLGKAPSDWSPFNNDFDFYLDEETYLDIGKTLSGGIENLTLEDQESWKIESEFAGINYRYIDMFLHFEQWTDHELTPGQYKLYISSNDTLSLLGFNPDLGENEILFSGSYSYGEIITIYYPDLLELFTSFYVENVTSSPEVVEINWLKLVRVGKGIEIIKDVHNHGKIVKMEFGTFNQFCGMQQNFAAQDYGTVEFWYKTPNTRIGGKIYSISENFGVIQKDGKWFVDGEDITEVQYGNVPEPINNTWHHVRIDWKGQFVVQEYPPNRPLAWREFRVYVDGYASDEFLMPSGIDDMSSINFETNGTVYLDAISYSWDSEYDVGDNLRSIYPDHIYEDIEIKFNVIDLEESEMDKRGFSYNSQEEVWTNYTYFWDFGDGNYSYVESPTYKFSNEGIYPVRLTLIDDQGAMRTKVKEFRIENKKPISSIVHGLNYDATYDFKYDLSDESPPEWITHGNIEVVDFKDEFSKVIEVDNSEGGYGSIKIPEPSLSFNGSIEFWIYFTDIANDEFFFWVDKLNESETILPIRNSTRFGFFNGKWMYYYSFKGPHNIDKFAYAEMTELGTPKNNEWVHIRFDYCWLNGLEYEELTGKEWRIFVNGNASNIYNAVGTEFRRKGLDVKAGSHIFLESFGFTTDPNYNLGDNNPPRSETYYGTWDFRFYPVGSVPYDETLKSSVLGPWMLGSYNFDRIADNCSASILAELDGHEKVLELQDNNESDYVFASLLDFAESNYGTIEFWLRTTDTSQGLIMALGYKVFGSAIWLGSNGRWWYKDGDQEIEITDVPTMENDTWHHIRIDFECREEGGYLQLTKNQFNFWVDGYFSQLGPYEFEYNASDFGWNIWSTEDQGANYSIFLDAIGASWDPAYEVGDNINPREAIINDVEIIFSAEYFDTPSDEKGLYYLWNFGDNQTAFGQTILHTYTRPGRYEVKLIIIDDNGLYDVSKQYIWIDNMYPGINISAPINNEFNEGETIILDCISYDTYTDYQQLIYTWGTLYDINIHDWLDNGWLYSHIFTDSSNDDPIVAFVGDPLYMWDVDSYDFTINNVLPSLDINSPGILVNISASIYNGGSEGANFSINILSNGELDTPLFTMFPSGSSENLLNLSLTNIVMDISKNWSVLVNQTEREGGEHLLQLTFLFENGYEITKSNNFDGINDLWTFNLNEMWINAINNLSNVPITFEASVTDPSNDKINLSIEHIIQLYYEINFSGSPYIKQFIINHEPNNVTIELEIMDILSKRYAVFKFLQPIENLWQTQLMSGIFPVSYDFSFSADMTDIDIFGQVDNIFLTEGINDRFLHNTSHYINAEFFEIDNFSEKLDFSIEYLITSSFEFGNLAPFIQFHAPINVTEDQLLAYYVDVNDFNNHNVSVSFTFGINNGSGLTYYDGIHIGNNRFGVNYSYTNAGQYILKVNTSDGFKESEKIQLVEVINRPPYGKMRLYQNETYEDEVIEFKADIYDSSSDIDSLRYFWDFGDGVCSGENSPTHSYFKAGNYVVTLKVKDDNGDSLHLFYNLTVLEKAPEILGPFSYTGYEGQAFTLDVEAVDSISDSLIEYTWDIYRAMKLYNGTYNFQDIDEGQIPNYPYFDYLVAPDISYSVIDDIGGHEKVLEIQDNNNAIEGYWQLQYGNSGTESGSIEFWLRSSYISDNTTNFAINLMTDGTGLIPIYVGDNGTFYYKNIYNGNSSEIENIPRLVSNTWHHIRIDYECGNGNYSGLGEEQWRITLDGAISSNFTMQIGPPFFDVLYLDTLQILSGNPYNMSIYCDAIGFHDDSTQYQIGDNMNQILYSYIYEESLYGKKPSVALDDGTYLIELEVSNDDSNQAEIAIEIMSQSPILTVPNKRYSGDTGNIEITAYARDSIIDVESLEFEWLIENDRITIQSLTLSSTINVFCEFTGKIKGYVSVRDDSDLIATSEFFVDVFMDRNGDGDSNEYEDLHNITSPDQDGDGLPNYYERTYTNTSEFMSDTDSDGLYDGYSGGILEGELTIGTDPLLNDTDTDGLIDGLEWYGWNVTRHTREGSYVLHYTSDPLAIDTDKDSILDGDEYKFSTNPRNPDTDNDGLSDFLEIHQYKTDPTNPDSDNDGIKDGKEIEIGTDFDNADTDADGIQDGAEYYGSWGFVTNPLCSDSDHDFISDNSEIIVHQFSIEERKSVNKPVTLTFEESKISKVEEAQIFFLLTYGEMAASSKVVDVRIQIFKLSSELIFLDEIFNLNNSERYISKSINIKEIMEKARESYYGDFVLKVIYLEDDHAELSLEEFEISVSTILDPTDNDYDNDGIWDGVETQLIVPGVDIKNYPDVNNLTTDVNSSIFNYYQVDISDIGIINNVDISFKIESNNTLIGTGAVMVIVVQNELDSRIPDREIYYSNISFSPTENFSEPYHIQPYVNFPYKWAGTYQIFINIADNNQTDIFNLIDIKVQIGGYRNATNLDIEAWITKPYSWDSDGDGWSDYYEIYDRSEPTNPLAWDSDGDKVKDSIDLDPLKNIMLEVELVKGHLGEINLLYLLRRPNPLMQMSVEYEPYPPTTIAGIVDQLLQGEVENIVYVSPHKSGTEDKTTSLSSGGLPYFGTAVFNYKCYIDIEDDTKTFDLLFKLWDEGPGTVDLYWDELRLSHWYTFNLGAHNIDEATTVEFVGSKYSSYDKIVANVKYTGIRRPNTIAIYDKFTTFNGHYQEFQSMHVIQISVTDTPSSSSPFVQGLNTILIPHSVMINSKLNKILLNETASANSVLATARCVAFDRENLPVSSSKKLEALFAIDCTSSEAEDILDLVIIGLINSTTQEVGYINYYASTKIDYFKIETMNVHPDIMILIPGISPAETSDEQGSLPKTGGEWWAEQTGLFIDAVVGFFTGNWTAVEKFWDRVVLYAYDVLKGIVSFFVNLGTYVISTMQKGIMQIDFFTTWALILLVVNEAMIKIAGLLYLISLAGTIDVLYTISRLDVIGDINFSFWYEIGSVHLDWLAYSLPTLEIYLESEEWAFEFEYAFDKIYFNFTKTPELLWDNATLIAVGIVKAITDVWQLCGTFNGIIAIGAGVSKADSGISLAGAVGGMVVSFGTFLYSYYIKQLGFFEEWGGNHLYLGLGIGFISSCVAALFAKQFSNLALSLAKSFSAQDLLQSLKPYKKIGRNTGILFLLDTKVLNTIVLSDDASLIVEAALSVYKGTIALAIGCTVLTLLEKTDAIIAKIVLGVIYLIIGVHYINEFLKEE